MTCIDIIHYKYLLEDHKTISIGGIETYITNLIHLFNKMGYKVRVFQPSSVEFQSQIGDVCVFGHKVNNVAYSRCVIGEVCKYASTQRKYDANYITIIGSDDLIPDFYIKNSVAIQHGITWDKPRYKNESLFVAYFKRVILNYITIKRLRNVDSIVAVDYNFLNWYRAINNLVKERVKINVIPNFAKLCELYEKKEMGIVNIIFARRFFDYRGSIVFTKVAIKLLDAYEDKIFITFAGDGPDKCKMTEMLKGYKNIRFITYKSEDSYRIHRGQDIAVVPTLGSEGTSLSLLEAMSSQCAVVCTNVGGMTNIVIDHYNGLMVNPDESELYNAMKEVIENENLRKRLIDNGYATVKDSFSLELWKQRWADFIKGFERSFTTA